MPFFITKDMVLETHRSGGVLELGPSTVMTSLARETAGKLGVPIRTGGAAKRRPLVAANWKMNHAAAATVAFFEEMRGSGRSVSGVEMLICPSHPFLLLAGHLLKDMPICLGAQDVAWAPGGALTGEVSASMLRECGCTHTIIGHSERRKYHPDESDRIADKLNMSLEAGLVPIVCVGENLADREHNRTYRVLKEQLNAAFASLSSELAATVIVAYEPVWAIGTGKVATVSQVADAHGFLRKTAALRYSMETASRCRILYGGSVKAKNAGPLIALEDVDGFLVGGASLKAAGFLAICQQVAASV